MISISIYVLHIPFWVTFREGASISSHGRNVLQNFFFNSLMLVLTFQNVPAPIASNNIALERDGEGRYKLGRALACPCPPRRPYMRGRGSGASTKEHHVVINLSLPNCNLAYTFNLRSSTSFYFIIKNEPID